MLCPYTICREMVHPQETGSCYSHELGEEISVGPESGLGKLTCPKLGCVNFT